MSEIDRPRLEGSVAVRDGRRLSFAEFGDPRGAAVIWMHGTPGARRQIPIEARAYAEEHDLRIIGVDRPGIGSSTPHLYRDILDWTDDLVELSDVLDIDKMRLIGLSGGGPYVLAAGAALADRVHGVGVLGGVAPTKGPDAIAGGLVSLAPYAAPVLSVARVPIGFALAQFIRLVRPIAGPIIDGYAAVQPRGDKELLARPEFRAMFLDDLLNGARFQSAPRSPTSSCSPGTGASRPTRCRCRCTGGTATPTTLSRTRTATHGFTAAAREVHHRRRGVPPRRARGRHRGAEPADGVGPRATASVPEPDNPRHNRHADEPIQGV